MSTLEKSIVDELVAQTAARAKSDHLLSQSISRIADLERCQHINFNSEEKWKRLRDQADAADPKITEMYKSAQELILELGRKKVSWETIRAAKRKLSEACREAYPHVDLIPF